MQEQLFCRMYNICFKSQCSFHACYLCEKLAYLTLMHTQIRTNPIRSRQPSGDFASSWFLIDCQACFTMTKWDIIILSGISAAAYCRYPNQGYKKNPKSRIIHFDCFFPIFIGHSIFQALQSCIQRYSSQTLLTFISSIASFLSPYSLFKCWKANHKYKHIKCI